MKNVYFFTVIYLALTNLFTAEDVEIYARIGSDVRFNLPSFITCGQYNITKGTDSNVIVVYNSTCRHTSNMYSDRSTTELLVNGTVQFTLRSIQRSDIATYLVRPKRNSSRACWIKYVLRVRRKDIRTTGYWLNWGSWSVCDVTCGAGTTIRQRECSIPDYCLSGSTRNAAPCQSSQPCITYATLQAHVLQWTAWTAWSPCSQTCGPGFRTRDRKCHNTHSIVQIDQCTGSSIEDTTCSSVSCVGPTGDETTSGIYPTQARDPTVELPFSVIVATGVGLLVLILVSVICVLVVKLRNKKDRLGINTTISSKRTNTLTNQTYRKESSTISCSSVRVSGVHVYDEIDDSKVNERNSVLTIDNPYVILPKSTSPMDTGQKDTVTYSNTTETVFVFDRNVSNAYMNARGAGRSNLLEVPRHMSIDSVGYLIPGNTMERAAKRNKKDIKKVH